MLKQKTVRGAGAQFSTPVGEETGWCKGLQNRTCREPQVPVPVSVGTFFGKSANAQTASFTAAADTDSDCWNREFLHKQYMLRRYTGPWGFLVFCMLLHIY